MAVFANLDQFWIFLSEDFFPPQFPTDIRMYNILDSVGVTIAMAISSTTIAGILAFFTALFASELVSPFPKCAKFVRGFATFCAIYRRLYGRLYCFPRLALAQALALRRF